MILCVSIKQNEVKPMQGSDKATKNADKQQLYALSFQRISDAIKQGFPIEALALEESIISDRLHSFIKDCFPADLKKCGDGGISDRLKVVRIYFAHEKHDILCRIKSWIGKRNQAIHGIVATKGGCKAKLTGANFISEAMAAAKKGEILAHKVSDWVRKVKRENAMKTI
jgi:hypothetical protein